MNNRRKQVDSVEIGVRLRSVLAEYLSEARSGAPLPGAFLDRIAIFGDLLALWGSKINLTSHPQDPEEIAFHVIDSLAPLLFGQPSVALGSAAETKATDARRTLVDAFAAGCRVLDFGSGAGFPGLILASACEARFSLAEARQKRASFLKVAAAQMGLENVQVIVGRLSSTTLGATFDTVVSRASGPAPGFYVIAAGALVPAGRAMLYSSPPQQLDLVAARSAGLGAHRSYRYAVKRTGGMVERLLAVWQKAEKAP